jgi:hypothetical protein
MSKLLLTSLAAAAVPAVAWAQLNLCDANLGTRQQAAHYGRGVDCSGSWTEALQGSQPHPCENLR